MSYLDERIKIGREPLTIVEMDIDRCANEFGVLPCEAVLTEPGSQCFNTFRTCQDLPNFNRSTFTHKFCENVPGLPVTLGAIPSITRGGVVLSPTILDPAKTLGIRGKVTITFQDHTYHDAQLDPYVDGRTYDPMETGTFWGKFLARNPNYENRPLRVTVGYLDDQNVFQPGDSRLYVIDKINGPDANGRVTLVAKDILKIAEDKSAKCPKASGGKLIADITDTQTSFDIDIAGGYSGALAAIKVDREVMLATLSGNTFTVTQRGAYNTEAKAHRTNAAVQECVIFDDMNVIDIVYFLLTDTDNGAGIDPSFINFSEWEFERDNWLFLNIYTRILATPTGITKLLSEISQQSLLSIWWDERVQQIKLRSSAPLIDISGVPTFRDGDSIIGNSLKLERLTQDRITQIWLYSELEDPVADPGKQESYQQLTIRSDLDSESPEGFGDKRERIILGTWLNNVSDAVKLDITFRTINKFKESPVKAVFKLDAKDSDAWTGDIIFIETDQIQDQFGRPTVLTLMVTKAREIDHGTTIEYEATTAFDYQLNYFRWAPAGIPDFTSATDEQKRTYGWWTDDGIGFLPGGVQPYVYL